MSLNMNPTIGTPLFQTSPAGSYTGSTGLSPQQLSTMIMGGTPSTTGGGGIFQDILENLGQIGSAVTPALPAIAGTLLTGEAYDRLSDVGREAQREALALAERGQAESQFRPFTVTTTTGGELGTRVTPTGAVETTMMASPEEQALQRQLFGGAGEFFGQAQAPTATREQQIFERMRAAQRPEEERQRLALEERLLSQGRLGTSSATYGGATPEQLALATAQEEARTRSMLGAMQQAQTEQAQQAALGQQLLGASYLPQAQLLAATQPALRTGELQQQAQLFGTGLFGETAMSGLESRLLAEQARANLLGGIGSNILAGMFTPQVTKSGTVLDPGGFGDIGEIIEGIGGGLGGLFGNIFG